MWGMSGLIRFIIRLSKLFIILSLIIWLPRFFLYAPVPVIPAITENSFKLGVENIPEHIIKYLRFGNDGGPFKCALVANTASINQQGQRTIDLLVAQGITITTIFEPGYEIDGQDGTPRSLDLPIGMRSIAIVRLNFNEDKLVEITASDFSDIDIFIVDMQDSGLQPFSYIFLLYNLMYIASQFHKKFIVLDRPNLLGYLVEGPLMYEQMMVNQSIALPFRHGMTFGEIARYINYYGLKNAIDLKVIPMQGYSRSKNIDMVNFYPLSMTIESPQVYNGYALTFLLSIVDPFFVGVSTSKPYQCCMLPKELGISAQVWHELQRILHEQYALESTYCSYFHKDMRRYYSGLFFTISDVHSISIEAFTSTILHFFHEQDIHISWKHKGSYQEIDKTLLQTINSMISRESNQQAIDDVQQFLQRVKPVFLYKPLPKIA